MQRPIGEDVGLPTEALHHVRHTRRALASYATPLSLQIPFTFVDLVLLLAHIGAVDVRSPASLPALRMTLALA